MYHARGGGFKKIAAHQLEAAPEDMVYDQSEGVVYVKGSPDKAKPFAELAFARQAMKTASKRVAADPDQISKDLNHQMLLLVFLEHY